MDDIDKKMEQNRLRKSVVKFWNVNYSVEQKKSVGVPASEEVQKAEREEKPGRDMNYNPKTGARSGDYGKQPVGAEHAEMIDSILDEKKFDLDKILQDTVTQKIETPHKAAQAAAEAMMQEMQSKEEAAVQTLQTLQADHVTAKAAAAVEEAKAASRVAESAESAESMETPQQAAQAAAEATVKEREGEQ